MKIPLLILLVCLTGAVSAQTSSRFAITRSVVAGGGATYSTGGPFQLGGTIGQPLVAVSSSGRFSIQGGFWIWPAPIIFAPAKIGNNFIFSFQTEPGKTYTALYVDSLPAANWQSLTPITGDGTIKSMTNSAPGVTQRFYILSEQ